MSSRRFLKGLQEMRKHLGPEADDYVERIKAISPAFAQVNVEFPFGDHANDRLLWISGRDQRPDVCAGRV